jgi:hypothetical protein
MRPVPPPPPPVNPTATILPQCGWGPPPHYSTAMAQQQSSVYVTGSAASRARTAVSVFLLLGFISSLIKTSVATPIAFKQSTNLRRANRIFHIYQLSRYLAPACETVS